MQAYVEPTLTEREGRAHWRAMLEEVNGRSLMASIDGWILARFFLLLFLFGVALGLSWLGGTWVERFVGYVALALLLGQFAFMGHDAGHGAISRRPGRDRALGQAAMTLVTGLAFDEWIGRHLAHHRYCQDETRDPDMMVSFVVSLTERAKHGKGPLGRLLTRYQAVHIWALSFLFGHSQRLLSQMEVARNIRRYSLDAAVLGCHFTLWIGLPVFLGVPMADILLAYLVPLTLLGPHLAAIFWVNHIGMPLVREPERFCYLEHQCVTSRTIVNPPAWNWLFGGLNFQVEHHLFPQVPSARLPAVHEIVRGHFARHAIPYNGVSWREALRSIAAHLREVAA